MAPSRSEPGQHPHEQRRHTRRRAAATQPGQGSYAASSQLSDLEGYANPHDTPENADESRTTATPRESYENTSCPSNFPAAARSVVDVSDMFRSRIRSASS